MAQSCLPKANFTLITGFTHTFNNTCLCLWCRSSRRWVIGAQEWSCQMIIRGLQGRVSSGSWLRGSALSSSYLDCDETTVRRNAWAMSEITTPSQKEECNNFSNLNLTHSAELLNNVRMWSSPSTKSVKWCRHVQLSMCNSASVFFWHFIKV